MSTTLEIIVGAGVEEVGGGAAVVDFISATAWSSASFRMSAREREAPRAKRVLHVAREIPEAAPVTAMILPARDAIVGV